MPKPTTTSSPSVAAASDDAAFLNEILVKQAVERVKGESKVGGAYDRISGALHLKHIMEDALGLAPTNRIVMPPWSTLNRADDTGEPYGPGITKEIYEGLQQRGPAPKKAIVTTPTGEPLNLRRSRLLENEPDVAASFVGGVIPSHSSE